MIGGVSQFAVTTGVLVGLDERVSMYTHIDTHTEI